MQVEKNSCQTCLWFKFKGLDFEPFESDPEVEKVQCFVFPEGIPERIYDGTSTHFNKYPGQTGDKVYFNIEKAR